MAGRYIPLFPAALLPAADRPRPLVLTIPKGGLTPLVEKKKFILFLATNTLTTFLMGQNTELVDESVKLIFDLRVQTNNIRNDMMAAQIVFLFPLHAIQKTWNLQTVNVILENNQPSSMT